MAAERSKQDTDQEDWEDPDPSFQAEVRKFACLPVLWPFTQL